MRRWIWVLAVIMVVGLGVALVATNQFKLTTNAGTYGTGGVKKYLCIQDGVLTVGATCP